MTTNPSQVRSIGCVTGDGRVLEADYRSEACVFRHRVRLLGRDGMTIADWDAVLLSEQEDWPASPPVQELSIERIGDRDCLLGVGRAGKSHWSISIETLANGTDEASSPAQPRTDASDSSRFPAGRALRFDIACRCPEPPVWLGSTYRTDAGGLIHLEPLGTTRAEWCGTRMLRIEPTVLPPTWPGTVRWQYDLVVSDLSAAAD